MAHVHVSAAASDEQYSSSSGIYSVEGSEGSNSPEYNSWRSRVQPQPRVESRVPPATSGPNTAVTSTHRWSIQGKPKL